MEGRDECITVDNMLVAKETTQEGISDWASGPYRGLPYIGESGLFNHNGYKNKWLHKYSITFVLKSNKHATCKF